MFVWLGTLFRWPTHFELNDRCAVELLKATLISRRAILWNKMWDFPCLRIRNNKNRNISFIFLHCTSSSACLPVNIRTPYTPKCGAHVFYCFHSHYPAHRVVCIVFTRTMMYVHHSLLRACLSNGTRLYIQIAHSNMGLMHRCSTAVATKTSPFSAGDACRAMQPEKAGAGSCRKFEVTVIGSVQTSDRASERENDNRESGGRTSEGGKESQQKSGESWLPGLRQNGKWKASTHAAATVADASARVLTARHVVGVDNLSQVTAIIMGMRTTAHSMDIYFSLIVHANRLVNFEIEVFHW